ncbi:MAG: glycosyltransferase [Bacteroidales bacterium]
MGYLCKYLQQSQWQPVVLTEYVNDGKAFAMLAGTCPAIYLNYYKATKQSFARWERRYVIAMDFCFGYKSRKMYRAACRLMQSHKFELILCSTYRDFPLPVARKVARKYRLPFVADLRDIIEQFPGNEFIAHQPPPCLERLLIPVFKWNSLRRRNRALRQASAVTTVSEWHVETLKQYNPQTVLIYNGYDPELFYPEKVFTEQFIITYTGRIHSTEMQNPALFMQALNVLTQDKTFSPDKLRVRWYMDEASKALIAAEAEQTGVLNYMDFMDYVPAEKIPDILRRSSVLLLLAAEPSDTGPKGIMTTKMFEYFGVEKPTLCTPSDRDCLEKTICAAGAGVAAASIQEVCDFLKTYFAQWKETGRTSVPVRHEVTAAFSRKAQAEQFTELFNKLTLPAKCV